MLIKGRIPAEIAEGPGAIRATVDAALPSSRAAAAALRKAGVHRVWVIGNGTSYHSALHAAGLARRLAGFGDPVIQAVTAGDFRTFPPEFGPADAIVGISASGEFRDVVGVFEEFRGRVPTIGVVHVPGSTLTRVSDHLIMSAGGPSDVPVMTKTFSSTLAATALVVGAILGEAALETVVAGLRAAADDAEWAIAAAEPLVGRLAGEMARAEHVFVVGGGMVHPAAMEAALKLKEMALIHAEPSETWEMATGPATMVGPGTVVLALAPAGGAQAATLDVARKCAEWGARLIEVAPERTIEGSAHLPIPAGADERFAALTAVPPVALLAYVLAGLRGFNPDRPGWTERYHSQGLTHIVGV